MNRAIYAIIFAASIHPATGQDANWHLMTKTYGGTVSLMNNLDQSACEFARNRALGLPATDEEREAERKRLELTNPPCPKDDLQIISTSEWREWSETHLSAQGCFYKNGAMSWGGGRLISEGDIKTAECFR